MLSYGQSIIDDIRNQQLEYLTKNGHSSSVTEAPTIHAQDDAEVSVENEISNDSSDISLDQSNNGFSLVNLHWASFRTDLSSVLAVVLAGLLIAGCCYFRGCWQHQMCAHHTELLHALSSSTHYVSSTVRPQSGAYPRPTSCSTNSVDTAGSPAYPIGRYSAPPASTSSCGLPGCATSLPLPLTTLVPHISCPSLTRHSRQFRMLTVPPRLQSPLLTASRLPRSRSTATSNRVPAKQASVPSTADHSPSVSPVVASSASSMPSSGHIIPAHSISDYTRRDFSRSAHPGSVFNLHVKY